MKTRHAAVLKTLLVCFVIGSASDGFCGVDVGNSARDFDKNGEMIREYLASLPIGSGEMHQSSPIFGTASDWYDMARDFAFFWSSDVVPVAVFNTDTLVIDGTCRGWGYSFHSQGMDSVMYVQVSDAEVQFGLAQPPLFTDPISGDWINSDVVIDLAEENGGTVYRSFNMGVLIQAFLSGQLYDLCIIDSYHWRVGYTSDSASELDFFIQAKDQRYFGYHSECEGSYQSAEEALQAVEGKALSWAEDAGLFRVESRGIMDVLGRSTSWSFEFLSNEQHGKRLYYACGDSVYTDRSKGVRGSWFPAVVSDGWLDSDSAIVCAERNGGEDYRAVHPLCTISASMTRLPAIPFNEHLWSVNYDDLYRERLVMLIGTESGIFKGAFHYKTNNDSLFTSNVYLPEARVDAQLWSDDAYLFGIISVRPLSFPHKGSSSAWAYVFYSPQLNEAVSITVQAEVLGPHVEVEPFANPWYPGEIAEGWLASDSVLVMAGHAGGDQVGSVFDEPVIETVMAKGLYAGDPQRTVWLISYHSSCQSGTFYLDAYTGVVVGGGLGVEESDEPSMHIPRAVELMQNYPNPFNPSTVVQFNVSESGGVLVTLRIYDIHGRYVRGLVNEVKEKGSHSVQWDGRNDRGEKVSSGVYLMKLEAGRTTSVRKMIMIK